MSIQVIDKMNKKGQIVIYLLLGVIIFIGFGFIFYLKGNDANEAKNEKVSRAPFATLPIKLYIENCLESTGKKALLHIGKHGGYYELKKPYLIDEDFKLPYYVFENLDFSPLITDIEKEISEYIDDNLKLCVNDFEEFKKQGFGINYGELKSKVTIRTDSININLNFPVTIQHEASIEDLNSFNTIVDVPLRKLYYIARNISNQQAQSSNSVCLSCLYDLADKHNVYIDIIKHTDTSLIFEIMDYNVTENLIIKRPYNFTFAVKLVNISCNNLLNLDDEYFVQRCTDEVVINSTQEITIEDIPKLTAIVGQSFTYKINAVGNKITFPDYSELFDVTNDGVISFTPSMSDIGNHTIWISVKDVLGNEKYKNFDIEVVE